MSGFSVDADGWLISGDANAASVKPDYNGTGGNPDGLISAKDEVTGGMWFFVAPQKYLGDLHLGRSSSNSAHVSSRIGCG